MNEIGLGIDFKEITQALRSVLEELDHRFLNELPMFASENPSSELIARWVFERLSECLNTPGIRVSRVTIWESDEASATYIPSP